ncbi:MAG: glycosyltransferase family 4 protein [Verrucomicrobiota bacterium]
MKVLQILPELNSGGVERGTLEVADYLIKNGHEALVVSNGGRQVKALEKMGGRHIAMPVHRKSLGSLFQVKAFRALLEIEKPDILHIRSRAPGWIAWLAWRKMDTATRPRLVSTVHGFYSVNAYSAIMTKGERVIAVSNSIRDYILKNYPKTKDEKITVIHRGVSLYHFERGHMPDRDWLKKWSGDFPQCEGKIILLLPGRVTRWKGQLDFIRMISALKNQGLNVCGLIVGETHPQKKEFETELRERIRELGLENDVLLLGHRSDIKEVMSVSNVVYSLSLDPEAFGRVSLEAMALGKPVVAYQHGGVEEQLLAAFPQGLVPVGDVTLAVDRTREILESRSQPDIPVDFTLDKMLATTLEVYEKAIKLPLLNDR